ncbi:hypothetical protein, partial [Marinibactrum halimedae]|uniref:hypothetical protein n=1 Tax=Marinibactrum halimedae TaxID=1444977 RepID=UPI001E2C2BFB
EKSQLTELHRNAQHLLKPLAVINPYADQLTFLDDKTRTRRDHEKYLTLIDSVALLHQYQRDIKSLNHNGNTLKYIEVQLSDIHTANRLAHDVLGRTLDELPAQTRKLLTLIQQMVATQCQTHSLVQKDVRFSRRHIREFTGWSDGQLKIHCSRLADLEYLLIHQGGRGSHLVYELLFDGCSDDEPHLMGLLDVEALGYDLEKSGVNRNKSGVERQTSAPSQGQVRPKSDPLKSIKPLNSKAYRETRQSNTEKAHQG